MLAFVLIVAGTDVAKATGLSGPVKGIWTLLRWPLSIGFVIVAFALLFRAAPRRHQPSWSWLAVGSGVSVLLWFVFTGLLAFYLNQSSGTFGQTYGPLTGIIAILIWTFLTSLAIYLGLAFAAQLEAVRAGVPGPRPASRPTRRAGRRGPGRRGVDQNSLNRRPPDVEALKARHRRAAPVVILGTFPITFRGDGAGSGADKDAGRPTLVQDRGLL